MTIQPMLNKAPIVWALAKRVWVFFSDLKFNDHFIFVNVYGSNEEL